MNPKQPPIRKAVVVKLRRLFQKHDKSELQLVKKLRREGMLSDDDLAEHDQLERDVLYAWADATDAEVEEAQSG